jgi:hypothetical protein
MERLKRPKMTTKRKAELAQTIEPPLQLSMSAQWGDECRRVEGIAHNMADIREYMDRALVQIWAWGNLVAAPEVPYEDDEILGSPRALTETFLREEEELQGE